ncbi:hypothetical protein BX616_010110 [Lobosporangium transversale]|uniref:T-box domain-containing protein n=1 Tax=Lobosporangium transversale TaxID=64571 RepID=A0A1Y2G9A1_9FUNG|nr:hypothetical protein BCR41DRAFT_400961 [Lobosporangium transversale]KAF9913382.1 hypothetical protein BX616_010110 [Lobosporangium transversale]ORZ04704.1 hypothetical protein BCR41DRAFT_400961 [Lobosporangium transversale]|eukprot:XP_021876701.1 hypothetical protein BCR41DRAFT_400961 [Lobosporangium transversale]
MSPVEGSKRSSGQPFERMKLRSATTSTKPAANRPGANKDLSSCNPCRIKEASPYEFSSSSLSSDTASEYECGQGGNHTPTLELVDDELWAKFFSLQNEMIITNSGRCLFPCLRFKATHLNPRTLYSITLEFEKVNPERFRFCNGQWTAISASARGNANVNDGAFADFVLAQESYMHPDGYRTGSHWMASQISFAKVKLSNKFPHSTTRHGKSQHGPSAKGDDHIFHMMSFYKYRPRVHLIECSSGSQTVISSVPHTFETTSFIAVTHYQNYRVNDLKKGYNPHAKGFRNTIGLLISQSTEPSHYLASPPRRSSIHPRSSKRLCLESVVSEINDNARNRNNMSDQEGVTMGETLSNDVESNKTEIDFIADSHTKSIIRASPKEIEQYSLGWEGDETLNPDPTKLTPSQLCCLDKNNTSLITISLSKRSVMENMISRKRIQCQDIQESAVPGAHQGQYASLIYQPITDFKESSTFSADYGRMWETATFHPLGPMLTSTPSTQLIDRSPLTGSAYKAERKSDLEYRVNELNRLQELFGHLNPLPPLPNFNSTEPDNLVGTPSDLLDITDPTLAILSNTADTNVVQNQAEIPPSVQSLEAGNNTVGMSLAQPVAPTSWYQQFFWDQYQPTSSSSTQSVQNDSLATMGFTAPTNISAGTALQLQLDLLALSQNQNSGRKILSPYSPSSSKGSRQCQQQQSQQARNPSQLPDYFGDALSQEGYQRRSNIYEASMHSASSTSLATPSDLCEYAKGSMQENEFGAGYNDGGYSCTQALALGNPQPLRATVLESKTYMSTSSVISLSPCPSNSTRAQLDQALHENLCLKAFIRERFGRDAENDANAVVAMQYHM